MMTASVEEQVLLPQNEAELEAFIISIAKEFSLPETDFVSDSIATMIMHLPANQAFVHRSHFGNGARKGLANLAAYTKLTALKKKRDEEEKLKKQNLSTSSQETVDGKPVQNS